MFTSFTAFLMIEMTALRMFRRDKHLLLDNIKKSRIYLLFVSIHCALCLCGCAAGTLIETLAPLGEISAILSAVIYIIIAAVYIVQAIKNKQAPVPKNISTTIVALQAILSGIYLFLCGVSSSLAKVNIIFMLALSVVLPAVIVYVGLGKYETKIKINTIILAVITILSACLDWVTSII